MTGQSVNSITELENLIQKSDANRLIVLDFYADWCGPCRAIAPFYEQLGAQFRNALFLKVNVDRARDISMRYGVRAMPTFVLLKNKQEVARIQGANQQALLEKIRSNYSSTPSNPNAASDEERKFLERFVPYCSQVKIYDDIVYKTLARSVIPEERLTESATIDGKLDRYLLLQELMNWFKNDFFEWCDSPNCLKCNLQCPKGKGLMGTPNRLEIESGANRVEIYECENCGSEVRFPRYNDPAKLLETRKGRCGEWANCFTLMASAMDFEIRFVLDTTDHVWTEVFLEDQNRWIHCDPCENVIDKPLLYEKGWGKKLSYVIGYGIDHVCDLTWRYVLDSKETANRRPVRSTVFESFIAKLNSRQMGEKSEERKKQLTQRRFAEIFEMMLNEENKKNMGEGLGGRTTGSEEWRKSRGEIGNQPNETSKYFVFEVDSEQEETKYFEMSYNCASDMYSMSEKKIGFAEKCFECKNIVRKVENDWKKVYLCRKEGKNEGEISWHFNFSGKEMEKMEIKVLGAEKFENGNVMVTACIGDTCMRIPKSGVLNLDGPPSGILKIMATLSGGSGSNAFQHSQLFRSDSEDQKNETLSVKAWFK